MKICLMNNLYKPYARGGAEKVTEMTARGLQKQGHEVFIITARPRKRRSIEAQKDELRVYRIWSPNLIFYGNLSKLAAPLRIFWHFLDMFNIAAAWKVRRIIRQEKPDAVFLHNLKGLSYLTPKFLKKENLVLIPHDVQLAVPSGVVFYPHPNLSLARWGITGGSAIFEKLYVHINQFLFDDIKKVIFPSKWLLDFYIERDFFKKARKAVLHNPTIVEPEALSDGPEALVGPEAPWALRAQRARSTALRAQHRPQPQINLLFVGQLEKSKGILFLINVLKDFRFQISDLRFNLIIVGDGSKREDVQKLIDGDERFEYLGKLDGNNLQKVYQEADYTIVPSLTQENCPTVILESIVHGTPVIASRIGGIPELVRHNESGLLFNAGDAGDLIKLLERLPNIDWQKLSETARTSAKIHALDKYINLLLNFSHQEDEQNALEREPCQMCK